MLLVENSGGQAVDAGVAYGSLSIDRVMNDFICSDQTISDNGLGALVVQLSDWTGSGSTSINSIANIELQFEIRPQNSYDAIDSPKRL